MNNRVSPQYNILQTQEQLTPLGLGAGTRGTEGPANTLTRKEQIRTTLSSQSTMNGEHTWAYCLLLLEHFVLLTFHCPLAPLRRPWCPGKQKGQSKELGIGSNWHE